MLFYETLYMDLNTNQKKLIDWLTKDLSTLLNLSINDVARINSVSPSFITKTLKKVGYYGWKDFRAFAVGTMVSSAPNSNYQRHIEKTLFPSISSTLNNIDELKIVDAANSILSTTGSIYFIGEGFSYFIAEDQRRRYSKIGIKNHAINSTNYEYQTIDENDLVFLISASGISESIKKTYKFLNEKNIKNILISANPKIKASYKNTIIGNIYDVSNTNEREFPKQSRIILLIILDWIFSKVQNKIKTKQ